MLLLCSSRPGLPQGLALAGCPLSEAQRLSCCYSAGVPCPPGSLPSTALALRTCQAQACGCLVSLVGSGCSQTFRNPALNGGGWAGAAGN